MLTGAIVAKPIDYTVPDDDSDWNDAYGMEAVDRTHIIRLMFYELLHDHPAIKRLPTGRKRVKRIATQLSKLYQELGAIYI
jgi:hypothetical protein